MSKDVKNALPTGHAVENYQVIDILGHGGFGITYRARHQRLNTDVAIKEYLPQDIALREGQTSVSPKSEKDREIYAWGLTRFLEEARILAQFKHPNIVGVRDFIEMNGTAYMVMEYEPGQTLTEWLERLSEPPKEETLKSIFIPILDGLRAVHEVGLLHRDIKPDNIYIREDGRPMLIDFGAARQALGERSRSLSVVVSEGYAPKEQYSSRGKQGPWTDIYGIGASLYRCINGKAPLGAMDRAEARYDDEPDPLIPAVEVGDRRGYSLEFLKTIDQGLAFLSQDRPQTVRAFHSLLIVPAEREKILTEETQAISDQTQRSDTAEFTITGADGSEEVVAEKQTKAEIKAEIALYVVFFGVVFLGFGSWGIFEEGLQREWTFIYVGMFAFGLLTLLVGIVVFDGSRRNNDERA